MFLNYFSVPILPDGAVHIETIYKQALDNLSRAIPEFQGMVGMIDDQRHEFVSLALTLREPDIEAARSSPENQRELALLRPWFASDPVRGVHKVEVRYFPRDRGLPEGGYHFARVTIGHVLPQHVAAKVDQIRDSFVYSALYQPGCTGYLLCSQQADGIVYGVSLWDSEEHRDASEGETGYYAREMARVQDNLTREPERRRYRVIARLLPPR